MPGPFSRWSDDMSLTLVATFNTKDEANRAVDALVEGGWDRRAVSTTVRRELGTGPVYSPLMKGGSFTGPNQSPEADSLKAIGLVALIGAVIGAAIGLMLAMGTFGLQVEQFRGSAALGLIAGATAGLAVGTYSGAVASVRKSRDRRLDQLSPYLSAKERVMVSMTVPDERQEAVSRILRKHGAYAVREWSLISNDTPRGLHV